MKTRARQGMVSRQLANCAVNNGRMLREGQIFVIADGNDYEYDKKRVNKNCNAAACGA